MESKSHAKIYMVEIKTLSLFCGGEGDEKKGGPKMQVLP